MDIKIINLNSAGLSDYSFGLYTWTKLAQSAAPGSEVLKFDSVDKFEVGSAFVMGLQAVDGYTDVIGAGMDDTKYVILKIDLANKLVTIDKPVVLGATAGVPCVKLDRGFAQMKKATGIVELVQYVQKCLLTTKGSDSFDPDFGCNIYMMLWKITPNQIDEAKASLIIEIDKLEKYVRQIQVGSTNKDMAKLSRIVVNNVSFDYNIKRWRFDVTVKAETGSSGTFSV